MILPKMIEVLIIHFADNIDETLESSSKIFNASKKGEKYFLKEENRDFFKSLNPDYNDV